MVYKHAYLNTLLLLHSVFILSVVKMALKGEVGNYTVDHEKPWKNHEIVFLNLCGNPGNIMTQSIEPQALCLNRVIVVCVENLCL